MRLRIAEFEIATFGRLLKSANGRQILAQLLKHPRFAGKPAMSTATGKVKQRRGKLLFPMKCPGSKCFTNKSEKLDFYFLSLEDTSP